jgi:hypothetical protein
MSREKTKITGVKGLFHETERVIRHGIFFRTVLVKNYKLKCRKKCKILDKKSEIL